MDDNASAGIRWWNGLSEPQRRDALLAAGPNASVADAFAHHCKATVNLFFDRNRIDCSKVSELPPIGDYCAEMESAVDAAWQRYWPIFVQMELSLPTFREVFRLGWNAAKTAS